MRTRIWNHLANIKFKAFYTNKCSSMCYHASNLISFVLAFASASSVITWAFWDRFPWLWTGIVGFSQILHVVKPCLPYLKNERDYIEMSLEFESLFLKYEKLWYDYEKERLDLSEAEKIFYELRQIEIDIDRNHKTVNYPEFKWIMQKTDKKMRDALKLIFA